MFYSHRKIFLPLFTAVGLLASALPATAGEKISLRSANADNLPRRITATLEVGGHLKPATEKKTDPVPMSVVAKFVYDEQRLDDGAAEANRLSLRLYDEVQVVIKAAATVDKPQLRDDRKLIACSAGSEGVFLASPRGPLAREELDLLEIPANSLLLEELLPSEAIAPGHRWKPTEKTLARLLNLDAVAHTDVECLLAEATDDTAEITFSGTLGGAIHGVATEIELKGKLLVDVKRQQPSSLILAIKENRGVGHVGPGLDVVAKLKLEIAPMVESKLLAADLLKDAQLPQTDEPPPLEYRSATQGYRFLYDRRWHITREEQQYVVLRLIDRGDLIAQCNVSAAAQSKEKPVELEQFQHEVQAALGKLFGKFELATERGTESGLRVLKSVTVGLAQDVPIQWRYYLVHDRAGHGVSAIFTLETPLVEQFGTSDKLIVESVEFLPAKVASESEAREGAVN